MNDAEKVTLVREALRSHTATCSCCPTLDESSVQRLAARAVMALNGRTIAAAVPSPAAPTGARFNEVDPDRYRMSAEEWAEVTGCPNCDPAPAARAEPAAEERPVPLLDAIEFEHHIETLREVARAATKRADALAAVRAVVSDTEQGDQ